MKRSTEDGALARAASRGWITHDELARWRDENLAAGARLAWLVQHGRLREDEVAELLSGAETDRGDDDATDVPSIAPHEDVLSEQLERGGRYRIEGRIGSGGAGVVYRAREIELDRLVAIKVLHATSDDTLARSLAEARAQARVAHAGVCQVYEVGEVAGRAYIAMQYIAGRTLRASCDDRSLSVEQLVGTVRDVARAVHAAHTTGLIHRDLKPANIVVESVGTEEARAYVLDFGVARIVTDTAGTITASVVGTPAYMAPEQVGEGQRIDRRTDVYGLGATLYEVLVGSPPFEGDAADILARIRTEDPMRPRRRRAEIPLDLDTIVMTCLEKQPERRYASAAELADDLDRYLRGEPIAAKRAGLARRAGVAIARHKAVSVLAALLAATLIAAGAWSIAERSAARRRAELAAWFGREAATIDAELRLAHLAPLHDTRPERAAVSARLRAIATKLSGLDEGERAPGEVALGAGHLALGQLDDARAALERARGAGATGPEVALLLGRTLAAIHHRELPAAMAIEDAGARAKKLAALETELARPALELLAHSATASTASRELVEATRLLEAGEIDASVAVASRAATKPGLYEAHVLIGRAHVRRGARLESEGAVPQARESFIAAESALATAASIARSDPQVHREHCVAARWLAEIRVTRLGEDVADALLANAATPCERAMRANPDEATAVAEHANVSLLRAEHARSGGGDPLPHYGDAIAILERASPISAAHPDVLTVVGETYARKGLHEVRYGGDVEATFASAIAMYERVLVPDPDAATAHTGLAIVHRALAERALKQTGGDPVPALTRAIHHAERAAELEPDSHAPWNNLGRVYMLRGSVELARGGDALVWAERAETALRERLSVDEDDGRILNNLGNAIYLRAEIERARGQDPRPSLARAKAVYEQTLVAQPRYAYAHGNVGGVHSLAASYELAAGLDPSASISAAIDAFERGLALNPKYGRAAAGIAAVHVIAARDLLRRDRDPAARLVLAREALDKARQIGGATQLAEHAAAIAIVETRWASRTNGVANAGGLTAADAELARETASQGTSSAYAMLAHVRFHRARLAPARDAAALLHAGLEAADAALAQNPRHAPALAARAGLLTMTAESAPSETRARLAADAELARDRARAIDPLVELPADESQRSL